MSGQYSYRNSPRAHLKTIELPVHKQRKDQSTGRINSMFTSKTPTLKDPEIKQLLAKFPVGDQEVIEDVPVANRENKATFKKAGLDYSLGLRHVLGKKPEEANGIPLQTLLKCIDNINKNCDTIDRKA